MTIINETEVWISLLSVDEHPPDDRTALAIWV